MLDTQPISNRKNRIVLDADIWNKLVQSQSDVEFCQSWLDILCSMVEEIQYAIVVWFDPSQQSFFPIAIYPRKQERLEQFQGSIELVVKEKKGVVLRQAHNDIGTDSACYHLGYPVKINETLHGVLAVQMPESSQGILQETMRLLQWSIIWLVDRARCQDSGLLTRTHQQLSQELDIISSVVRQPHFKGAVIALVNQFSHQFQAHRVSIGKVYGKNIKLNAVSHSAYFQEQMNVVQRICAAMEESIDQESIIHFPAVEGSTTLGYAHEKLAHQENDAVICTVPMLGDQEKIVGAVTLERIEKNPFDAPTIESVTKILTICAPILEEKEENDKWLLKKIWNSVLSRIKRLVGPGYLMYKFGVTAIVALVLFLCLATGDYRVTAPTTLEGEIQRALVSPFNGYVKDSFARAGDVVQEGQVICELDDEDLRLERLNAISLRQKYEKALRESMAENNMAQMKILQQQINQSAAQIDLLSKQIDRTKIKAPFAGVLVNGDLSKLLGAPIEKGQVLFELAPMDHYRVVMEISEADIRDVRDNQPGILILTSLPNKSFEISVNKITPITITKEGKTYFSVEATLKNPEPSLRPGMEGYGKLNVDHRKLIWIWTHDMIHWAKLKLWKWLP